MAGAADDDAGWLLLQAVHPVRQCGWNERQFELHRQREECGWRSRLLLLPRCVCLPLIGAAIALARSRSCTSTCNAATSTRSRSSCSRGMQQQTSCCRRSAAS